MTDPVRQFALQLLNIYTGGMLTMMIDIGYQTGLFEISRHGPATSWELSKRAGLHERYVREWLGAMTTGGIYEYDDETGMYFLPEIHAAMLTGTTARNLSPTSRIINVLGEQIPTIVDRFRDGQGIPYTAYGVDFYHAMDDLWRRIYDEQLVNGFLGKFADFSEALRQGIRVLDIGCGTGHAVNVLAKEFPHSTFVGYDISAESIALANEEAREHGLTNTTFAIMDAVHFPTRPGFDLVLAFDTIHDLPQPEVVLDRIRQALTPGGAFLMVEFKFHSQVGGNIGNPFAPFYYAASLLHCTPVSLAYGGPGLGAVWGEQTAREMLISAGFSRIEVVDSPRPQNYMFLCRP